MWVPESMNWWVVLGWVFWGALVFLTVWAVRGSTEQSSEGEGDSLDIAKKRYARGDISKEEFEQIKEDLA